MTSAVIDVVSEAMRNRYYRRVLYTGARSQLVVMALPPYGEVGEERHRAVEQTIVVVDGYGTIYLDGRHRAVHAGDAVVVAPGTTHNLVAATVPLHLYTVYVPPNHIDGRVHRTKADADADEADRAFGRAVEHRAMRAG